MARGGNSDCAQWCHDILSGSAAGYCTSDAAHRSGLCTQWGPAAPAGYPDVCARRCCATAQPTCCGGTTCVSTASDANNCGTCGHVCPPDTFCGVGLCSCGKFSRCPDGGC